MSNTYSIKAVLMSCAIVCFAYMINGCVYNVESELYPAGLVCDSVAISFSADVQPVIVNRCLQCHNASDATAGIVLETYEQVKLIVDAGLIPCVVNHEENCPQMPFNSPQLPECQLKAINVWIAEGALDN